MNSLKLLVAIIVVTFGDIANAFNCTQEGVFKNTDTNDCQSYVACSSDLQPLVENCPDNTYFWPVGKGCFSNYNCATGSMFKNPCEGLWHKNIPDDSVADCSTYISCRLTPVYTRSFYLEMPFVRYITCPSGTLYSPWHEECVDASLYQCSKNACNGSGNFVNRKANDCSSFIKCSWRQVHDGFVGQLDIVAKVNNCSTGTKYSPFTKTCDALYDCDGIDAYNGVYPCVEFNHADPFVPHPFDIKSYIECSTTPFGVDFVTILKRDCPANYSFSPLLGKCYDNYDPNVNCSKDPCSSGNGRYVDYKSDGCENFIECRDESKDSRLYDPVYQKIYCPTGRRYSPELKKCSSQYVCPTFAVDYCYPQIQTTPSPQSGQ